MQLNKHRLARPLTIAAGAALGLGGLLAAPAAFADAPLQNAPISGDAYQQEAQTLLGDPTIQAVGKDASGNIVVVKTAGDAGQGLEALTSKYDNVVVKQVTAPLKDFAATDVVGGAGYITTPDPSDDSAPEFLCSVGFTGWTPSGGPAIISAGHCANDGTGATNTVSLLTKPSGDQAGGGDDSTVDVSSAGALGTFGFHQFGSATPNGAGDGAEGSKDSIDVSVIDVTNPNLSLLPEVTDWTTSGSEDLSTSGTTITSVGSAIIGQTVTKSGRTTGETSGTVTMVDGWADISGHYVYGFGGGLHSDHGDSGGALFQGNTAVGILSGGGTLDDGSDFTWASDLQNDLAHTSGYTVRLALSAPAVSSPASGSTILTGSTISGTGPANTQILLNTTGTATQGLSAQAAKTVTTDASGNWTTTAPDVPGSLHLTAQAKNGFNLSSTNAYDFTVKPVPPVIVTPVPSEYAPLTAVTGTGLPGAVVTVTGAVSGTATVDTNGNWSLPTSLGYGFSYSISATQSLGGAVSDSTTSRFSIFPTPPVVVSPAPNSTFTSATAPTTMSGNGITGANVTVAQGAKEIGPVTVVNGTWSVPITLASGTNAFSVVQQIGDVSSSVNLVVTVADPATNPAVSTTPRASGGAKATALADTGSDVTGASLLGALLIAAGLGATIVVRRRRSVRD